MLLHLLYLLFRQFLQAARNLGGWQLCRTLRLELTAQGCKLFRGWHSRRMLLILRKLISGCIMRCIGRLLSLATFGNERTLILL